MPRTMSVTGQLNVIADKNDESELTIETTETNAHKKFKLILILQLIQ